MSILRRRHPARLSPALPTFLRDTSLSGETDEALLPNHFATRRFTLILSGTVCLAAGAEELDISGRTMISAASREKASALAQAILNIANPTSTVCY